MNGTSHYRQRAAHYRRAADKTDDPGLREQFNIFAGDYDELAERSDGGALDTTREAKENLISPE